jgi:gliding motility-associated-like protein
MLKYLPLFLIPLFVFAFSQRLSGQCNEPFPLSTGPQACQDAPLFCANADLDGYCSATGNTGVGPCPPPFCSGCQNYQWFRFVAGTQQLSLLITPSNCSFNNQGLQAEMYETEDCISFTSVSNCANPGAPIPITITANNLTPGEEYYVMIDGFSMDICDFTIEITQGSIADLPPPVINGSISGPTQVCPGASVTYSVPESFGITDYDWTLTPPIGVISNNGNSTVTVNYVAPGNTQLCVTPTACTTGPPVCMTVVSTPIPPTFHNITFCLGDSWTCEGQTFYNPGQQQFMYDSWLGCDSLVICIGIAIPPIVMPPVQAAICEGDSYSFAGNTYTETGGYPVTLTAANGCDSVVTLILLVMEAEAIIQPPPILGCEPTATVVLDGTASTSAPASSNAVLTYSWTGPGIVSGANTLTPTVNEPGEYILTVTQSDLGVTCTDVASVIVVQDTAVPNPPTLTGPLNPCTNTTTTYTATPVGSPPPTGYTWTVTGGTFVQNNNTIQVTWTTAGPGEVCVTANNACGSSPPVCLNINVELGPEVPALTGPVEVCEGDIVYYFIDPVDPNTTSYNWTVGGNASYTDLGDSLMVDFSGATSGQICVTGTNACGTSAPACIDVTVVYLPAQPVISGVASVCNGDVETYSVPADTNATSYNWTVPAGATINSGQGTNSIEINWTGASSGSVCVRALNSCGQSPQACFPVTVNDAPTAVLSGGGDFCAGSGETVNLSIDLTGASPWDIVYAIDGIPQPALIGVTSDPYILTTGTPGVYTLVSLDNIAPCPGLVSGTATVTENPLPSALLSGSGSICQGSGDCVELSVLLTGTPPWTLEFALNGVPQAPITGIADNPYLYQACQGGTYEILMVTDANGCEETGSGTSTVTVNTAPIVSGIMVECNPTNTGYTVSFTISGGDPASYTVNGSSAGIAPGPPYVFTSAEIPNGDGYSFVVDDANNCNPTTVAQTSVLCDCTTAVGDMDPVMITACGETACITAIYDPAGEGFDGDDVLQFILHQGNGVTIVDELARNSVPTFCFDQMPGAQYGITYYISAVVGNDMGGGMVDLSDPCLAVAQGTPVIFYEEPTALLTGDATICEGESADLSISFTGPGPYSLSYDDGSGVQTINGINANPYILNVTPAATTTYTLTAVSNANCTGTAGGTATVTVQLEVVVSNVGVACNSTNTAYVVTFEISEGDPASYTVTPAGSGTITPGSPALFESDPIAAGNPYSFQVTDANGCTVITVASAGPVNCDCTTAVGEMDLNPIEECGDGPVTAIYNSAGQNFDGDDVLEFILHNGAGPAIEYPIIARSDVPVFGFDPAQMDYGVTYYISAIVGSDDGTGSVNDQNDPCLSVAPGTPVTFYQVPTATLSGTQEICIGSNAQLQVQFTGDAPWMIQLSNGVDLDTTITGINSTTYHYTLAAPSGVATYTILAAQDENCDALISGSATVTVNEPPVNDAPVVTINATNTGYVVCFTISGGEPPYTVTDGVNNWIVDSVFCSEELPCGSGYYFEYDDGNGCGPGIVSEPMVVCACTTAAGEMDLTPIEICGAGPAVATYDPTSQVLDGDDVVDFILHNGNYVPIATSLTPSFSFTGLLTYGTTYYISARAGNNNGSGYVSPADPCLSVSPGTPVTFFQIPTATLTGGGDFCAGMPVEMTVQISGGVAPWQLTFTNTQGQQETIDVPSSPHTISVMPPGTTLYNLVNVADAHCTGTNVSGIAAFTEHDQPYAVNVQVMTDPTNTFVTVCFNIVGGDAASYLVTGGPGSITGTQFCSDPILCDAGSYQFLLQDAYACGIDTIAGPVVCDCISSAGIMDQNLISVCEFETATAPPASATQFDGNDVLVYVLHTGSGSALGTIIASSLTPEFAYDPAIMNCNVNYYLSSVVGDNDGTGMVDLTDECLSVAVGTPVIFRCLPTVSISGGGTICLGSTKTLYLSLGNGLYDVVVDVNGQDTTLYNVANSHPYIVSPAGTTTYTLVSVYSLATGCFNTASGSVTVTVSEPLYAGSALPDYELCQGENQVILLNDLLDGEDPGGVWTEISSTPSSGGAFSSAAGSFNPAAQAPGVYRFRYFQNSPPPCPDDQEIVEVIIHPLPVADAGPQQELTCDVTVVTLGGGSSSGPEFAYAWSLLGDPGILGTDPVLSVSMPGTYQLAVTNTQTGCAATAQVAVLQNVDLPEATLLVKDVTCFGDGDGAIYVESVSGGKSPYLFSINGGPYTSQQQFTNLSPGEYLIAIEDANGCGIEIPAQIIEPDELTAVIITDLPQMDNGDYLLEWGDELKLHLESSYPYAELDTIVWTPSDWIVCEDIFCSSVTAAPLQAALFQVSVAWGPCEASAQLRVLVRKTRGVYVPNVFSPNKDGQNDIFYIQAGEMVSSIRTFQVFDRWGEHLFHAENFPPNSPRYGWDGNFHDSPLDPGVYIWFAEVEYVDGLVELIKGTVSLVR